MHSCLFRQECNTTKYCKHLPGAEHVHAELVEGLFGDCAAWFAVHVDDQVVARRHDRLCAAEEAAVARTVAVHVGEGLKLLGVLSINQLILSFFNIFAPDFPWD